MREGDVIHKAIITLLVVATLGTAALWAFAFFGGPYTADWDLTDQTWLQVELWGPATCELIITYFPHLSELAGTTLEPFGRDRVKMLKTVRRQFSGFGGRPFRSPSTTLGFGWNYWLSGKPGYQLRVRQWNLVFPFWAAILLFAVYPTIVFIRRPFRQARRRRNGWCLGCGYDLQGNVSGVCPECGKEVVITP